MASADCDAMVALFRSTDGGSWVDNANWATDADLSTWYGVKVDEGGRVVALCLTNNDLQGPVPEEIAALTNLTDLSLWENRLTGPIPEALGALTNLTKLGLNDNQLTGPIPEALGALTNLAQLDLGINQLTGPIPEALGSLTNLMGLSLWNNKLSGPIPEALGALTNLAELVLWSNQLIGPIPEALGALTNLTELSLSNNPLTGPIPGALGALTDLTTVSLWSNQLAGPIPKALGALTNIRSLLLNNNELTGPIPEALGALTHLKQLDLSKNLLTGTVPLGVWKLPCTEGVDLSENLLTFFTDPGEKTAPTRVVLGCMERLERLREGHEYKPAVGLITSGNPWEFPPAAVVVNGRESVRKYYDTWEQCGFSLVEIHALKAVVVGAYGAGKTSLARSIRMGRGDRTPEVAENRRTTVGIDILPHILRDGTECKIYDVAGQITYYGLHQFFLTERAVYAIVLDATIFEGLSGKDLDQAIQDDILEWVSLLHMRTPLCTVMLVASHFDMLHGATRQDNEQLLATVEERFLELHAKWMSLRNHQNSSMDTRMIILPGIFPVGCKLASESAAYTAGDGLLEVEEALSTQMAVVSRVPPSWVAARQVLEQVGSVHGGGCGHTAAMGGRRRPWELRSVIHTAFKNALQGEGQQHSLSFLSRLDNDGIRHSMDGAIELRAFSGTVISHDVFVVLDVMWLAGVLKPILDHRGVIKNEMGETVFADRELNTGTLLTWASELVGRGILRKGFARFLWSLEKQITEGVDHPHEMEPAKFEEILEEIGVTIPLPEPPSRTSVDKSTDNTPSAAAADAKSTGDGDDGSRRGGMDLLVIMRLRLSADAKTRENLSLARSAAVHSHDSNGGSSGLKAVFEFDHAGAPYGLPERLMALSHKIGVFSPRARWRLGGLFLLRNVLGVASSMILEYDKKRKTLCIEALGQTTTDIQAVQFVISALYHVAREFPGASWTGWMECGMGHDDERMYHLATSHEKQNQRPGAEIIPLNRNSPSDRGSKQENLCGMQGLDQRGSCTVDPDVFGRVLDVKQAFKISSEGEERFDGLKGRSTSANPSTTSQKLTEIAQRMDRVEGGIRRVEEGIQKIDAGMQELASGMQAMTRGIQQSLVRLKQLQAPNYRYPHLVEVKELQPEGTRSLRNRLGGMFAVDMTLNFLCSFDMSKVPCGVGGAGYQLRKTRGWVKKISPALQVAEVTARVALKAVAGVEVPALSAFLQTAQEGVVEEIVDRTLNEDVLLRVLSGDEDAGAGMRRDMRASFEAIAEFMAKEEARSRKSRRNDDSYIDFRDRMEQVHDEKQELVWVRTENLQKWRDSLATAAPST